MKQNQLFMKTYSGQVYEIELPSQVEPQKSTLCFSYILSQNFFINELAEEKTKLRKQQAFRQLHRNQLTSSENIQYLFNHVQGRTIDQELINEQSNKRSKIPIEKINVYLKQLLGALYILHRQNILGRVFSPSNIIDNKDYGIVLMDFGFGPDLYQPDLDITVPPEIVEQLKLKQQQQTELKYDLKLDSWLIGAFLYYLVKTIPVNAIKDNKSGNFTFLKYNQQDLRLYDEFFKQQAKQNQKCINLTSSRFTLEFCKFVSDLLIYNPKERLSFSEIYSNYFVKSLKINDEEEIIEFYKNLEKDQSELIYKVHQRERQNLSFVAQTNTPNSFNNQIGSYLNINELFIYNFQDFEKSKYKKNWIYLNMEQFKFFLLNNTADDVILHFPGLNYEQKHIAAFILRKMSLLILKQLIFDLKNTQSPWGQIDNNQWKQFQSESQCKLLLKELKQEKQKLKISLKQYFQQYCKKKQTQKQDLSLRKFLQQDIENEFSFKQSSLNFYKNGFRQTTKNIYEFLQKKSNQSQIFQQIQIKIILCHFMNNLFNLDKINDQFKYIKPSTDDYLTPNEIYLFINSQNNQTEQKEQIKLIISKNQRHQE